MVRKTAKKSKLLVDVHEHYECSFHVLRLLLTLFTWYYVNKCNKFIKHSPPVSTALSDTSCLFKSESLLPSSGCPPKSIRSSGEKLNFVEDPSNMLSSFFLFQKSVQRAGSFRQILRKRKKEEFSKEHLFSFCLFYIDICRRACMGLHLRLLNILQHMTKLPVELDSLAPRV